MFGIYAIILVVALSGVGLFVHGYAESKKAEGRAECQAQIKAANDSIDAMAGAWIGEYDNHIADMATVWDTAESQAKTRTIVVQSKGAQDVAKNPQLSNQSCAIAAEMVRNVNAGLLGMRREPPADGVRNDAGVSQGAGAGAATNPGGAAQGVRGSDAAAGRDAGGSVPEAPRDRRPLGKVHPKG